MDKVLRVCDVNRCAPQRLYRELFPDRRYPYYKTIPNIELRAENAKCFTPRRSFNASLTFELTCHPILHTGCQDIGVIRTVYRGLQKYNLYCTPTTCSYGTLYQLRTNLSREILQKIQRNPDFIHNVLFIDLSTKR